MVKLLRIAFADNTEQDQHSMGLVDYTQNQIQSFFLEIKGDHKLSRTVFKFFNF